jgi:hypothetical protein
MQLVRWSGDEARMVKKLMRSHDGSISAVLRSFAGTNGDGFPPLVPCTGQQEFIALSLMMPCVMGMGAILVEHLWVSNF